MITTAKLEKPRIPIEIFKKMVETMSPKELGALPPEKLPIKIPQEMIDEAPYEKQQILEDLLFAAEAYQINERSRIEEKFGVDVASAVEVSRQGGSSALHKNFGKSIQQMNDLYSKWETSQSSEVHKQLQTGILKLDELVPSVREDSSQLASACNVLQEIKGRGEEDELVFDEAREALVTYLQEIDEGLGEYFVIRLMVMGVELQRTANKVEGMDKNVEAANRDIQALEKRLGEYSRIHKIKPADMARNEDVQQMRRELEQLRQEQNDNDVLISEKDLIEWLDVIVDASLSPVSQTKIMGKTKDVRMALFQLLVRYCKSQEDAAKQVADNPFSQQDPEQVIKFMLKSEKFVLDYFANKRKNLTEWLGEAAQKKMDTLDDLESSMLSTVRDKMQK